MKIEELSPRMPKYFIGSFEFAVVFVVFDVVVVHGHRLAGNYTANKDLITATRELQQQ